MILRLPQSSGNALGFLIQGKLTDEDYQEELIPAMEAVIRADEKINLLFQMDKFEGWTAHGAWDDFINWPKFMSIRRMAIVVDDNWHEFATWLFSVFASLTHMELRFYRKTQLPEAWSWLRES